MFAGVREQATVRLVTNHTGADEAEPRDILALHDRFEEERVRRALCNAQVRHARRECVCRELDIHRDRVTLLLDADEPVDLIE
jgi:hypothetical protein